MNIDVTALLYGKFFILVDVQLAKYYIRKVISPGFIGNNFMISQKMSILAPCFQLNIAGVAIIADLYTIAYYERKVG